MPPTPFVDQPNSPFLQLPAEIRNEIYEYHVWQEHGFIHDPSTGKLHQLDGTTPGRTRLDNGLVYTCKQIAHEAQGVAFNRNSITFRPQLSASTATEAESDAELFDDQLCHHREVLCVMLCFAHELVTPEVLQALAEKWPGSEAVDGPRKRVASQGTHGIECRDTWNRLWTRGTDEATLYQILSDLVQIISKHTDFD